MRHLLLRGAAAAAFALSATATATAQNWEAAPAYGTAELSAGFLPDPHTLDLQAGGSIDVAQTIGGDCVGMVADAPDYDLVYTAGGYGLTIGVEADADTTLVVNGPDGSWYCNDDSDGFDPALTFDAPQSGLYDIWVGTYSDDGLQPATLFITELGDDTATTPAPTGGPDWQLPATFGDVNLVTGFTPDPHTVEMTAGGDIDASSTPGGECRGFIAQAPDFDLVYEAGDTFPLIISVGAEADTTLVVNGPDGAWYCDDDGGEGFNPSLRFDAPQSGLYDIWVGTYSGPDLAPATLTISEVGSE